MARDLVLAEGKRAFVIRHVWQDLQSFLAPRAKRSLGLLALESLIAGLLEAALLVLVVAAALAVADQGSSVGLDLPLLGTLEFDPGRSLLVAGAAGFAVLLIHLHVARLTARLSGEVLYAARDQAIRAFANASWSRQAEEREGALQETASTLAIQTSALIMQLSVYLAAAIGLVALLFGAVVIDPLVTIVVLAFGAVLFVALRPVGRATRRRSRDFVTQNSGFTESMGQWTSLAMELRVFGVEGVEVGRLTEKNRMASAALIRARFMNRAGSALYRDLAILFLVGAVAVFLLGDIELVAVGAVVLLIVRSLSYAQNANSALQSINEMGPNLESIQQRLTSLAVDFESSGHQQLDSMTTIYLQHVSYEYEPGRFGVAGVDLVIDRGEAIGVIGPSGGGKSTLVQVLLRLRRPTDGAVTVSGIAYDDIEAASWHRLVALVAQEPSLFQGTVAENIAFFRSGISRTRIEQAAADAHVYDEIVLLPRGFDTQLGPRGIGVSGGQKQRIAIARALVGDPQLLVLDEPTSALDVRSEQLLQRTIEELKGRVTLVIVAHRLTTLSSCDRVVAMSEGRVRAVGSLEHALAALSFANELLEPES